MAEQVFSYQEAIAHGWKMTRKYWKVVLVISVIYILFNVLSGVMGQFTGSKIVVKQEIEEIFKDEARVGQFVLYLRNEGYIDEFGRVEPKFEEEVAARQFHVPVEFQDKRDQIDQFLVKYTYRLPFPKPVYYALSIVLWVFSMLMAAGYQKMYLMMSRDQEPPVMELFSNWNILIPYILATICYALVIMGGMILLIVPGIIFIFMFQMFPYLIIDQGLGPIESLNRSRALTKGSKRRLFVMSMLLLLLNLAGLLCLGVGLIVTISISSVAMAYIYDRLGEADELKLLS